MSLFKSIIKKVTSQESLASSRSQRRFPSPPPDEIPMAIIQKIANKKMHNKFAHVTPVVDSKPPKYHRRHLLSKWPTWAVDQRDILLFNMKMVTILRKIQLCGGKIDSRWKVMPRRNLSGYYNRRNFLKNVHTDNLVLYNVVKDSIPKVPTTVSLNRDWIRNRRVIVKQAYKKFVLFPPIPTEDIEDLAFKAPSSVKRQRVFITLRQKGGAVIGDLQIELFQDVCPNTCRLFIDLLKGDGHGYGYIGTQFYRKVPHLYWTGGDVTYDNGFGCYMQAGRSFPIQAENYHFSHTMPGLLSMKMTCDNEMCGIFNITFKPLPQFDLKNVVFGRVVRPSYVFDSICGVGTPLSNRPIIEISDAKRLVKVNGQRRWRHGLPNTNLVPPTPRRFKVPKRLADLEPVS